MRAVLCKQWGPPEDLVIAEVDMPQPGNGQVRVQVRACGVNFTDTLLIEGKYQEKPAHPFSPGFEVAGTIAALGPGVSGFAVGDRVIAVSGFGGFAEEVVVSAVGVARIPDSIDFAQAAVVPVGYGTASIALNHRAHLSPGEFLLVNGATGGVGLAAVQLGKLIGARVIAVVSTEDRRELAHSQGADFVIGYHDEMVPDRVYEITGNHGADVIFDPVGGSAFDQALRCIAWEGRMLIIGFSSGVIPSIAANQVLDKNISISGVYMAAYLRHSPRTLTDALSVLLQAYQNGKIKPYISHTLPLERAADALRLIADRKTKGKIALIVGDDH